MRVHKTFRSFEDFSSAIIQGDVSIKIMQSGRFQADLVQINKGDILIGFHNTNRKTI